MKRSQIAALAVVLVAIAGLVALKSSGRQAPPAAPRSDATVQAAARETQSVSRPAPAGALPRLLELGSVGCKPCEHMAPIIEALEKELTGKVIVKFHDVSKEPALAEKYQIVTIPTQVFLDGDGKELFRHIGIFERDEILAKMRT